MKTEDAVHIYIEREYGRLYKERTSAETIPQGQCSLVGEGASQGVLLRRTLLSAAVFLSRKQKKERRIRDGSS